jgi:N-acetylmuramoyl-L-alanine amidase CwlA
MKLWQDMKKFLVGFLEKRKTENDMKVDKRYIKPNKWTRPEAKRTKTRYIDIHDPGGTLDIENLWQFINNRQGSYGSYNTLIGHNGDIWELMPNNEISYSNGHLSGLTKFAKQRFPALSARGKQNIESFGVCMCRVDSVGNMTDATWDAAVWYLRMKLDMWKLQPSDIIPHFHITHGKIDPLLFSRNSSELERFRWEIQNAGK